MNTTVQAGGVTAHRVGPFQRMQCLPKRFGALAVITEHRIYNMLGILCREYVGGYWEYFELSNGGFYMAPRSDTPFTVTVEGNGYVGRMSPDAAGIVACAMTFSHMSFLENGGQYYAEAFHQLRDYLMEHPESGVILSALD